MYRRRYRKSIIGRNHVGEHLSKTSRILGPKLERRSLNFRL
jgi:hypothetical protein